MTPRFDQAAKLSQQKSNYSVIKIVTWLCGFRVKIAKFSQPGHCLAIPRRDKENQTQNIEKWPESLRVMLEFQYILYRMWAIVRYWIINDGLPIYE